MSEPYTGWLEQRATARRNADTLRIVWTRPKFKPEFEHIRRCATLYLDNLQPAGISTGFCHTCGEWEIGMRFDAACTCGYRQDGLVWWMVHGRDEQNDLHDLYDALDQY